MVPIDAPGLGMTFSAILCCSLLLSASCEPPSQPLSCLHSVDVRLRSGVNRLDTDIKLVGKFQVPSPPLPWFSGSMVGWPHSVLDSFLAAVSRLWIPPSPFSLNSSMLYFPVDFSRSPLLDVDLFRGREMDVPRGFSWNRILAVLSILPRKFGDYASAHTAIEPDNCVAHRFLSGPSSLHSLAWISIAQIRESVDMWSGALRILSTNLSHMPHCDGRPDHSVASVKTPNSPAVSIRQNSSQGELPSFVDRSIYIPKMEYGEFVVVHGLVLCGIVPSVIVPIGLVL
ncbi:hypothetical protein ABKN59_002407 [Abortiporus biennis]